MYVEITDLKHLDKEKYDQFLLNSRDASIYHSSGWGRVMKDTFGFRPIYLIAKDNSDKIRGALPLFECKSMFSGNKLISTPFFIFGGAIYKDEAVLSELIKTAAKLRTELDSNYLLLKQRSDLPNAITDKHDLERSVYEHTFYLHLSKDANAIWKKLPKGSVRWGVKTARRNNVSVEDVQEISGLKQFYKLFLISKRHNGIPAYPFSLFENIWKEFRESGNVRVSLAFHEGVPIAGIVVFLYNKQINYAHAGARTEKHFMAMHPYNLLLWEAIEYGCKNGFEIFDLHGATPSLKGLYNFKKRWADEIVELPYYYFPGDFEYADPGEKFTTLRKIWSKIPLPLAEQLSKHVIKHLVR